MKPDLETVIFDMMCENDSWTPPTDELLNKWIKDFPYYEEELRDFVGGWRLFDEANQGNNPPHLV